MWKKGRKRGKESMEERLRTGPEQGSGAGEERMNSRDSVERSMEL